MAEIEHPQIYLITPPSFELSTFGKTLEAALEAAPVACVRLALATHEEDAICRAADVVRGITHARDIALVIDTHVVLAERLGLDGVHLRDGAHGVRAARKVLGDEAIVGAQSGTSRHDGINAGEAGADYVCFGPVGASALGDGSRAEPELFEWWSEMIEVPVVAEGALDLHLIRELAPVTDFFGIGEEIWNSDDPAGALAGFHAAMTAG